MEDTSWSTRHSCLLYFIEFATVTQHGDRGWNRTDFPIDINPSITHPAHGRLYHTTWVYAPYSLRTAVWVLLRPTRIKALKELSGEVKRCPLKTSFNGPYNLYTVVSNYQQIFISNSWFRSGRRSKVGWNKVRCCEGKNISFRNLRNGRCYKAVM